MMPRNPLFYHLLQYLVNFFSSPFGSSCEAVIIVVVAVVFTVAGLSFVSPLVSLVMHQLGFVWSRKDSQNISEDS